MLKNERTSTTKSYSQVLCRRCLFTQKHKQQRIKSDKNAHKGTDDMRWL